MTKNNVFGENKCDQLIKGCDVTKKSGYLVTHNGSRVISRDHICVFWTWGKLEQFGNAWTKRTLFFFSNMIIYLGPWPRGPDRLLKPPLFGLNPLIIWFPGPLGAPCWAFGINSGALFGDWKRPWLFWPYCCWFWLPCWPWYWNDGWRGW